MSSAHCFTLHASPLTPLRYIKAGILFKFAIDAKRLYGCDDLAAKEAGHTLRHTVVLSQVGVSVRLRSCVFSSRSTPLQATHAHDSFCFLNPTQNLRLPLVVVIDYLGFRLTAMSLLPIAGRATLAYGSPDGGVSFKVDRDVALCVDEVGKRLNLKHHAIYADAATTTCMPSDIEVAAASIAIVRVLIVLLLASLSLTVSALSAPRRCTVALLMAASTAWM